jgi:hypothetical protein
LCTKPLGEVLRVVMQSDSAVGKVKLGDQHSNGYSTPASFARTWNQRGCGTLFPVRMNMLKAVLSPVARLISTGRTVVNRGASSLVNHRIKFVSRSFDQLGSARQDAAESA